VNVSIKGVPLVVHAADDDASRAKGLMHAADLEENSGVLFRWPTSEPRSFWMKDTGIPLDIAFISDTGEIMSIQEMEPFSLKSVVSPGPASCALEVNRGWFKKNGLQAGDFVNGIFNDMPKLSEAVGLREQSEYRLSDTDFYYNDVIDDVINDVISLLPDEMGDEEVEVDDIFDYSWPYPIDSDVWAENYDDGSLPFFEVNVEIVPVDFEESHPGWNIDAHAGWGGESGSVEITISLRPGFQVTTKEIMALERELANVVAHEIHHLTQEGGPFERPSCSRLPPATGDSYYEYFTSACETPAFLIGFRAESSRTGRPVEDLVKGYLENQVSANLIDASEASDIADRWLGHNKWNREEE
jgi:uncharacterized membrane protein (UPF0127 family)